MRPTLTSEPERSSSPVSFAFGFSPRHTLSASGPSSTGGSSVLSLSMPFGTAFGSSGIAWSMTSGSHARGVPTLRTDAPCNERRALAFVVECSRCSEDRAEPPLTLIASNAIAETLIELRRLFGWYRPREPPVEVVPAWRGLDYRCRLWPVLRYLRSVAVNPERLDLRGVLCLAVAWAAEQMNSEVSITPRL